MNQVKIFRVTQDDGEIFDFNATDLRKTFQQSGAIPQNVEDALGKMMKTLPWTQKNGGERLMF